MKNLSYQKDIIKKSKDNIKNFEVVYEEYQNKIYKYFSIRVNNQQVAEDLTSITFEKALKNIKTFKWQGISISAWLYQIARNTLIDFYRKEAKKKETQLTENISVKDTSPQIEDQLIEQDSATTLELIINQLPERERDIVKLKFYEGMTNKEIAKLLNISETNVSTILHRTMRKLEKLILESDMQIF